MRACRHPDVLALTVARGIVARCLDGPERHAFSVVAGRKGHGLGVWSMQRLLGLVSGDGRLRCVSHHLRGIDLREQPDIGLISYSPVSRFLTPGIQKFGEGSCRSPSEARERGVNA